MKKHSLEKVVPKYFCSWPDSHHAHTAKSTTCAPVSTRRQKQHIDISGPLYQGGYPDNGLRSAGHTALAPIQLRR